MEKTGRPKSKGIALSFLQDTRLDNGRTLDHYLLQQPEKFALALCQVLKSMNRFSEQTIVYISNKQTEDLLHVVVEHASNKVDIRGRYKEDEILFQDVIPPEMTSKDLLLTRYIPATVLGHLEKKENKEKLFEELKELQVYLHREWLGYSNFYTS